MSKMYWESDANKQALAGKKVAVLGYGSQGRAQALNLRDSGINVVLGLRPGSPTWKQAEGDGWKPGAGRRRREIGRRRLFVGSRSGAGAASTRMSWRPI